jgi:lipopolysaccharide export system permease protein
MSTHRIYRYLLRETLVPMFLGLTVFTLVLLMGRILKLVELVVNKGVPLMDILLLFASLLPSFLVLTLPLSFLLGIMAGLGRMSSDLEILALKASGTSLYQIAKPLAALALAVSLATALLTTTVRPASEQFFKQKLFDIASNRANIGIEPQVFNDEFEGIVIYANDIDERSGAMQGVFISDERKNTLPAIILASSGHIVSSPSTLTMTLHLEGGTIQRQGGGSANAFQVVGFHQYDLSLDLGQDSASVNKPRKRRKTMFLDELRHELHATPVADRDTERYRELSAEYQWRLALPVAPLVFVLIGIPLGIQPVRSGRGSGFAIGLLVFLGYYLLLSLANTLVVESGQPGFIIWMPNLVFLAIGLAILKAAAMERPLPLVQAGRRWTEYLCRRLWKK